jgi:hypothetical protein
MPQERRDASARSARPSAQRAGGGRPRSSARHRRTLSERGSLQALTSRLRQLLAEALQARGCGVVAEAANGDANGPRCGPLNLVGGPRLAFGASRSNPPGVTSQLRAGQTEAR